MLILNVKEKFIYVMRVGNWHSSCQTEEVSYNCHSIRKISFTTLATAEQDRKWNCLHLETALPVREDISLCSGLYSQFE